MLCKSFSMWGKRIYERISNNYWNIPFYTDVFLIFFSPLIQIITLGDCLCVRFHNLLISAFDRSIREKYTYRSDYQYVWFRWAENKYQELCGFKNRTRWLLVCSDTNIPLYWGPDSLLKTPSHHSPRRYLTNTSHPTSLTITHTSHTQAQPKTSAFLHAVSALWSSERRFVQKLRFCPCPFWSRCPPPPFVYQADRKIKDCPNSSPSSHLY